MLTKIRCEQRWFILGLAVSDAKTRDFVARISESIRLGTDLIQRFLGFLEIVFCLKTSLESRS